VKRLCFLIYALCSVSTTFAIDSINLKLSTINAIGWQAEGVVMQWHWLRSKQIGLTLNIANLSLPSLKKPLKKISINCKAIKYSSEKIVCADANLSTNILNKVNLSFSYIFSSQSLQIHTKKFVFAGGRVNLNVKSTLKGWQVQANLNYIALDKFLKRLNYNFDLPLKYSLKGNTRLKIKLSGKTKLRNFSIDGNIDNFNFSNKDETHVGENLRLNLAIKGQKLTTGFKLQGTLKLKHGELLIEPVYLDIKKDKPINLKVDLAWQAQHLKLHHFSYKHDKVINIQGIGEFTKNNNWVINNLIVKSDKTSLKALYSHYLSNLLEEDNQLKVNGAIQAKLNWQKENRHLVAKLYNINIEDKQKHFGLEKIRGKIQWHSNKDNFPSHIHWLKGYFASSVQLGRSQIRASLTGKRIKLLAPWYQPVSDGAIRIAEFQLEKTQKISGFLRGKLYPISFSKLTKALDGIPLQGTISGDIPLISFNDKHIEIGGHLRIHIFDGEIVIRSLSLDNFFEDIPLLKANIDVKKLNLKTLTNVTQFGEMQGLLSGYIKNLHLENWTPVFFDAYFGTPADDSMPHVISQKAVRKIAQLGGDGVVNALSRSILSFFEEFYYKRIGWGCRLENGTCEMSGTEPALNGYYIIKGSGLPRIDVIGYNSIVDWDVLITRLKRIANVQNMQEPVVE
jgi:hypothetical protein